MAELGSENGLAGLAGTRAALVSDALDRLGMRQQAMEPAVAPLWPGVTLLGRAVPVVVRASDRTPYEPYATEIEAINTLSPGDVPIYSVEEGVQAALWGELFACAARARGAVGAVVDGNVRDVRQIVELDYPVFCRGRSLQDTLGRAEVIDVGSPTRCGGVVIHCGDVVVGDDDGVVVIPTEALGDVVALVSERARDERGALTDLLAGATIGEVWSKWRVL